MDVKDFYIEQLCLPFKYGVNDCCSCVDKWIELATGNSPMKEAGIVVDSEEDVRAVLDQSNLVKKTIAVMSNYQKTKAPEEGDVGLLFLDEKQVCMGIFDGEHWFARNKEGLSMLDKNKFLIAWSI